MKTVSRRMTSLEQEPERFVVPQIDVPSSTLSAAQRMWIALVHWDLFELRATAFNVDEFIAFASDKAALESFCGSLPRDAMLRLLGILDGLKSNRRKSKRG